jgi:hypothetical protein
MMARRSWGEVFRAALGSGSIASVASSVALAVLSEAEGHGALQPVNATSHWVHGPRAARVRALDAGHTGVGYATHHAATIFWAIFFERAVGRRPGVSRVIGTAVAVSATAAAVDYIATPKRFTPGWEFVLSKPAMAATYAAMAAGFALAALGRRR